MVSRRSMSLLAILALTAGSQAAAQVRPLGAVDQRSRVQPASCQSCVDQSSVVGYGDCCSGDYGTVWGASCMDPCSCRPGLYPPCPNPCRTTLVCDLLRDVGCAVTTSVSHVLSFALHPCGVRGYACGAPGCGVCDPCGMETYSCCECAPSGCDCGGSSFQMSPLNVGQPAPATLNDPENPFRDDPEPQGSGAAVAPQTTHMRSVLPAPRAAIPARTQRRVVRRASYQEAVQHTSRAARAKPGVRPATPTKLTAPQHYRPQRTTSLRAANGVKLQQVPPNQSTAPALRFREGQ